MDFALTIVDFHMNYMENPHKSTISGPISGKLYMENGPELVDFS